MYFAPIYPVEEFYLKSKSSTTNKRKRFSLKFCPQCGSTDVFWAQGMPQFWSLWQCRNCGYRGPVILEDGNMAEKLQEEWKNKK
jgi:predicted RNA-binding Zn-ribbon protein involved in translation (DUF1610 family)